MTGKYCPSGRFEDDIVDESLNSEIRSEMGEMGAMGG